MRRLFSVIALMAMFLLLLCASAFGIGGVSSGGGARSSAPSSSSSSGSRSSAPSSSSGTSRPSSSSPGSSGAKSNAPATPKAGSGGVRPSSFARPSSGRVQQSAPAGRLTPRSLPPNIRVPRGRNFIRDTSRLRSSPRYYDPYDPLYFGNPASPYYYLYIASIMDNSHPNPAPYQAPNCKPKKKGMSTGLAVGLIILFSIICGIAGFAIGRASADNTRGGW